jgi:hypothetical protein
VVPFSTLTATEAGWTGLTLLLVTLGRRSQVCFGVQVAGRSGRREAATQRGPDGKPTARPRHL